MSWMIDVSEHNNRPRFAPLADEGITAAAAKMTEGAGYEDPDGTDNLRRIISTGLDPYAYHFLWGKYSPVRQARFFYNQVAKVVNPARVKMIVDVEISGNMTPRYYPTFNDVKLFMHELQNLLPDEQLGIYSGYYWREDQHLGNPSIARLDLKMKPLIWDAHYFADWQAPFRQLYREVPAGYWNQNAFGGAQADILQYTSKGVVGPFVGDVNRVGP